ncbi:MAG TPA: hypothetical protein VHE14_05265, partial [Solirubrobacteraceae bacterium]|nr:hypothetical protein [Solirubrobacteraceae bacterium]
GSAASWRAVTQSPVQDLLSGIPCPADGNGAVRDIYQTDLTTGVIQLLSLAPGGAPANGPSITPSLAAGSLAVAFASAASNLVPGDGSGRNEVFVREATGRIQRASVAGDGRQSNGDSSQPRISADGRFVAFTSSASNLVPGDTTGALDIFVRDMVAGTTTRASVATGGGEANGASYNPAISPDGSFVSFTSNATNLVADDGNGVADVFLRDLVRGITTRVSVSTDGSEQNASITPPFTQVSDVSRDGRFVTFDSDASNLVSGRGNSRTNVFVHDVNHHVTSRISVSSSGEPAANDSFAPVITPDGRFIAFESFADNIAFGDAPGEDIFVHDRTRGTTVVADVSADGSPRGPEVTRPLLQRPSISDAGTVLALQSGADNLVPNKTNGLDDIFVRRLTPVPSARVARSVAVHGKHATVRFSSGDPTAGVVLCRLDRRTQQLCPLGATKFSNLKPGRHVVRGYAGGPGSLFSLTPLVVHFRVPRR